MKQVKQGVTLALLVVCLACPACRWGSLAGAPAMERFGRLWSPRSGEAEAGQPRNRSEEPPPAVPTLPEA